MNQRDDRPVGLIYTGGTFGMQQSDRGYEPSEDLPQRVERDVPELHASGMPPIEWIEHDAGPPLNSSDVTPPLWYALANTIRAHADRCRGFVVIHGTDTLAYTGSALSFLQPAGNQPVIVTGASRPLGEPGSDAPANLLNSLRVIAAAVTSETGIVFGDRLLRANRATKRHGSYTQPFVSPVCDPLAQIGERIEYRASAGGERPADTAGIRATDAADVRIAMLPAYPGLDARTFNAVVGSGVQGIVLEAYPAGIGPGGDRAFVDAVAAAHARGVVVGAVSQARDGRIRMGRYASSTPLATAGVVSGGDMTREAALAKLHVLFAGGATPESAREQFARNLQGELTDE
ncbi:asparaginase [Halofilum ochraceum]|uniref:asparaginase n=1 Tax=Halofilum ochraceum TaxID=1611323 RepID=UPI0008DAE1D3|nr:asparaginase domain-containing protein [Halofilum ochraceum]